MATWQQRKFKRAARGMEIRSALTSPALTLSSSRDTLAQAGRVPQDRAQNPSVKLRLG